MDHQRLGRVPRQLDLGSERALLVGPGRGIPVVVEAGLADGDALAVGGERLELGQIGVVKARGFVRMTTDRGIDLGEVLRCFERGPAALAIRPHGHDLLDAGLRRRSHQLSVRPLAEAEMGVAVDHWRVSGRGRGSPPLRKQRLERGDLRARGSEPRTELVRGRWHEWMQKRVHRAEPFD